MSNNESSSFKDYFLPVSILVAAILISGALLITAGDSSSNPADSNNGEQSAQNVAEVTEEDHIRGSIDAPIKIVEYSDLECPFCQQFHDTMKQVVEEYDQVAWVYRHFPLTNAHPSAMEASEASECVAELEGEEAFWTFVDSIFEKQSQLGSGLIEDTAIDVGVDLSDYQECMESNRYISKINNQVDNAINSGASGTPFSVIISEDGSYTPLPGALPFSSASRPDMETALDQLISNL